MTTETTDTTAASSPLERQVRRYGEGTDAAFAKLRLGALRKRDVCALIGAGNTQRLLRAGVLSEYKDADPHYAQGLPGKKPMCMWVELGDVQYIPKASRPITKALAVAREQRKSKRLAAAIAFIESRGYAVTAPNVGGNRLAPTQEQR